MPKIKVKILSVFAALMLAAGAFSVDLPQVNAVEKPVLCLGAELTSDERSLVLSMLGVKESQLDDYQITTVSIKEEHAVFDDLLPQSVIGRRSLSSVLIKPGRAGSGINVAIENINYCVAETYQNKLITAGVKDAEVKVAAPYPVSGSAALLGILKSYELVTETELDGEAKDAAIAEFVLTAQLSGSWNDSMLAEEFTSEVKRQVIEASAPTPEEIAEIIRKTADKMNVKLTSDQMEKLIDAMKKISELDISPQDLIDQGKKIYDDVVVPNSDYFRGIGQWFTSLWNTIFGG